MTKTLAIILSISMTLGIFATMSSNVNSEEAVIKEVGLYLYDTGSNGRLSANFPQGNNTTEVQCSGTQSTGSSLVGGYVNPNAYVGTWKLGMITSSVKINADVSVIFWAKSNEGARDTTFRFRINYNDNNIADFQVNAGDLNPTPKKVIADGTLNSETELKSGDTFELQIYYYAGSNPIFGNDAEILVGGVIQNEATNLAVKPKTSPLSIVAISTTTTDIVTISANLNESFGADLSKLFYEVKIGGNVQGKSISSVKTGGGENNTIVSFEWDYKRDGATEGKYTISLGVSYNGKDKVINTTTMELKFSTSNGGEGNSGILGLPKIAGIDPTIIIVGGAIGVGVGVGAFLTVKKRKGTIKFKTKGQTQPQTIPQKKQP